jgi:hypothetical protein
MTARDMKEQIVDRWPPWDATDEERAAWFRAKWGHDPMPLDGLREPNDKTLKYSEDQPRDNDGQWSAGGGGGGGGGSPHATATAAYPMAGETVDGRTVGSDVKNLDSIAATLDDGYTVLPGIREVSMEGWNAKPEAMFYAADDRRRVAVLADRIRESGRIDPLIVVVDNDGPYVLEGGHRLAALYTLGAKSFPALVVLDAELDAPPPNKTKGRRLGLKYSEDPPTPNDTLQPNEDRPNAL